MKPGKLIWITTGYREYARYGPDAINVDRLSLLVGKSRSSFYHNFGSREGFEEALYDYHLEVSRQVAADIDPLEHLIPDYTTLLATKYKDWVFFRRQMYLQSSGNKRCAQVFKSTGDLTGQKSAMLWCKEAGLCNAPREEMHEFYKMVREGFFTLIDYQSFTPQKFEEVVREINRSFQFLLEK